MTLEKLWPQPRKAVKLDDSLAEAHTSLANALVLNHQFSDAVPEFQRAIELNPNYATAHHWYGEELQNDGRLMKRWRNSGARTNLIHYRW